MKLYVLVADGWTHDYGSENYLVGVYDNKSDAETVEQQIKDLDRDIGTDIIEIDLNTTHPLTKDDSFMSDYINDLYIGGYVE